MQLIQPGMNSTSNQRRKQNEKITGKFNKVNQFLDLTLKTQNIGKPWEDEICCLA